MNYFEIDSHSKCLVCFVKYDSPDRKSVNFNYTSAVPSEALVPT